MQKEFCSQVILDLKGRRVGVKFIRNHLARRIIMRLDQDPEKTEDGIAITLPSRTSVEHGLNFVEDKIDWILKRLDGLAPRIPLKDGSLVPLGGVNHIISHAPEKRGLVWVEGHKIFVPGRIEHLKRRARDWFIEEARDRIQLKVYEKTSVLGNKPGRIKIRDTKSRWGSCSYNGNLSFSWRLVMAPESILDYVVAHEVSHLVEHNHSPKFWELVSSLTENMIESRKWLKINGEGLHRIG